MVHKQIEDLAAYMSEFLDTVHGHLEGHASGELRVRVDSRGLSEQDAQLLR